MTALAENPYRAPEKEQKEEPKPKPVNPDWKPMKDPASGETYFHNPKTGETAWEAPPPDLPKSLEEQKAEQEAQVRKKFAAKQEKKAQRRLDPRRHERNQESESSESEESDEELKALLEDSEDEDLVDAEELDRERRLMQAQRVAERQKTTEYVLTPWNRLRAAWRTVFFFTYLSKTVRDRRAADKTEGSAEFEQLMYAALEYGGSWMKRVLMLPLQSIIKEEQLDLEVVLPDEGGLFGWGAVTDEDITQRVMQSRVRVARVMHILIKDVEGIPSAVINFLKILVSMHVYHPADYLYNSEKMCLIPEDWGMFSVENDLSASFLIIKFVFVRLLIFNVMLTDMKDEAEEISDATHATQALRNIRTLSSQFYWLTQEYLKSDEGRPLLTIGIWKEVLSDLDGDGIMDRYWWNIETGETSWTLPDGLEDPNQEIIDDEKSRAEDMQPQVQDPLLADKCKPHIAAEIPHLGEWVGAILARIKASSVEDNMGRRYYWDDPEQVPASPRARGGSKKP